jgi:hypothetical protein
MPVTPAMPRDSSAIGIAELRLVGENADQEAREPGSAIEQVQCAAEQRRGEESILAVADIDEHRREGRRDQQRLTPGQNRADHGQMAARLATSQIARPQGKAATTTATAKKNGG